MKIFAKRERKAAGVRWLFILAVVCFLFSGTSAEAAGEAGILDTPQLYKASAKQDKIVVTWKKVKDAQSYWVYRKEGSGKYTRIAKAKAAQGLSYTDTSIMPGRIYTYTVIATAKQQGVTVKSSYEEEGVSAKAKIPAVVLSKITASGSKITLKWKSMKGVAGYRIYRKEGKKSYKKVADVMGSSASKYTDKKVQMGHSYTYTVRALVEEDGEYLKGQYNKKGLTADVPVSQTYLIDVDASSGRILLNWKTIPATDGYIIYRKEETAKKFSRLTTIYNHSKNFYWDTTAKPGKRYSYSICTFLKVNGKTVKSAQHTFASKVLCYPGTPIITSLVRGSKKDTLTWTSARGAAGYVIYKKNDTTNKKWVQVKAVSKSVTTLRITRDKGVTTYMVRAWVKYGKKKIYSQFKDSLTNSPGEYRNSKILFDGDSITKGLTWSLSTAKLSYPTRVSQLTGASCDNIAVSGSTLARRSKSDARSMVSRMEANKTDYTGYSVICLASGTNDYKYNIELGNPDSTSDKTFYGALNRIFERIQMQNPEARVVLITPTYRGRWESDYSKVGMNATNEKGYTLADYCDAIKNVAEKYGAYIYDSEAAGVISADNYMAATYDALHPVEETYCQIGKSIAAFLMKKVLVKDK